MRFKSSIALSNSALVAKEASSFIEAASKYEQKLFVLLLN
jgi:hypothetical protein